MPLVRRLGTDGKVVSGRGPVLPVLTLNSSGAFNIY